MPFAPMATGTRMRWPTLRLRLITVATLPGKRQRRARRHRGGVAAGLAFDIVDVERGERVIAGAQETRQHDVGDDRIAHGQRPVGMADLVLAHRHDHQAQLAIEVGHVERDVGDAAGAHLHEAGEQRHGLDRNDAQRTAAEAVAAFAHRADGVLLGLDQAAVIVAHADAETALAEVPGVRIGRFVIGELEDALVHRGEREIGVLARAEALHRHRNGDLLARRDLRRSADQRGQRARRIVERQPGRGRWSAPAHARSRRAADGNR